VPCYYLRAVKLQEPPLPKRKRSLADYQQRATTSVTANGAAEAAVTPPSAVRSPSDVTANQRAADKYGQRALFLRKQRAVGGDAYLYIFQRAVVGSTAWTVLAG